MRPVALPLGDEPGVDRALRLPHLVGARRDAVAALSELFVVVVGVGSIGGRMALGLARMGVRRLLLVDPGRYKPESLLTHDITPIEVGQPKAAAVAARARAIHPTGDVLVFDGSVSELRDGDLIDADAVLLATDDLLAEVAAGARAQRLCLRLIQASVDGPTLVAQVRTWPHADGGDDACLLCGFGPTERAALDAGTRFRCAGDGHGRDEQLRTSAPTRSAAALCALAADLAVLEVLRLAAGVGAARGACLVEHAALVDRTSVTPLRRNPGCRAEHVVPRRARLLRAVRDHTPAELLAAAGVSASDRWSLALDGFELAEAPACACLGLPALPRFLPAWGSPPPCSRCGAVLRAPRWSRHREAPGELLAEVLHVPLRELGATDPRLATIDAGRGRLLLGDPS